VEAALAPRPETDRTPHRGRAEISLDMRNTNHLSEAHHPRLRIDNAARSARGSGRDVPRATFDQIGSPTADVENSTVQRSRSAVPRGRPTGRRAAASAPVLLLLFPCYSRASIAPSRTNWASARRLIVFSLLFTMTAVWGAPRK
jgi:hypothetical protein